MKYIQKQINGFEWLIPRLLYSEKSFPAISQEDTLHSGRSGEDYCLDMFIDANFCASKVIVDVCSGQGNLDDLAKIADRFIRIDKLYEDNSLVNGLLRKSICPDKYTFFATDSYHLPVPSQTADLVLENYGLLYYFSDFVFGDYQPINTTLEDYLDNSSPNVLNAVQQGLFWFLASLGEKIRIGKHGADILIGPKPYTSRIQCFDTFIKPSIDLLQKQQILKDFNWQSGYAHIVKS
ncbi:MAG: hypothetical protein AABX27_05810 [Nanoarchaeota archaeon]